MRLVHLPRFPRGKSAAPLPGDANGDGKVDINDLTIVLTNYDQTGMTWSQGDFNGDGKVDINDLTIVLTNYGTTSGTGLAAVPEPSCVVLARHQCDRLARLPLAKAERVAPSRSQTFTLGAKGLSDEYLPSVQDQ